MAEWVLYVRSSDRRVATMIDEFDTLTLSQNFNGVGGWFVKGVPMDSDAGRAMVPGSGLIAVRDGVVEMSGPLLQPAVSWGEDGWVMNASGASDDLAVFARLCYPDAPSVNLNADYSDDRTGVASTIMRQYVDVNVGPSAHATRQWSGLVLAADPVLGVAVSYSARLDLLGDVLTQLALVGGDLGFRVVQDVDDTDLSFQVYAPTDRSGTAIFSPDFGNLAAYDYSRRAPVLTRSIVGGGGEGTLRTFIERGDAAAEVLWGMRLEGFKDQRQTTVVDELEQAGDEEIADKGEQVALSITPVDTTAVSFATGYRVGDLVTVLIDGVPVVDRLRTIELVLDAGGERVLPTIGTSGAIEAGTSEDAAMDLLLARMMDMSRRLTRLATAT